MYTRRRLGWMALCVIVSGLTCTGCQQQRKASGADQVAIQIADAESALQGSWVLVQAQPDPPLDPVLSSLLTAQLGRMQLLFDHGLLTGQGVGLQFERRYQVVSAEFGGRVHVVLRDELGSVSEVDGEFQGDTVRFNGRTSPWIGTGVMQRAGR